MGAAIYVLTFAMLLVGVYAVVAKKNIIKIIVGVLIIDYAVNMLLVLVGYRSGGKAVRRVDTDTAAAKTAQADNGAADLIKDKAKRGYGRCRGAARGQERVGCGQSCCQSADRCKGCSVCRSEYNAGDVVVDTIQHAD